MRSLSLALHCIAFLPRSLYGAVLCLCAGKSLEKPGMCQLVLSSACRAPRAFLLLRLPRQRAGWGCTRRCEGTQRGHLTPIEQRDSAHRTTACSAGKGGGGGWRGLPLLGDCLGIGRLVVSTCFLSHRFFVLAFIFLFLLLVCGGFFLHFFVTSKTVFT